jgi:spore maturation protein CgeB
MNILYLGSMAAGATSRHRADALRRCGHLVDALDLADALGPALQGIVLPRVHYGTGFRLIQSKVLAIIQSNADRLSRSDVVWIDSGELVGPRILEQIRRLGPKIVLFNADDPTGGRDGRRFDSLVAALPLYDLCVTVRDETLAEFRQRGARAIKTWRGVDEIVHAPRAPEEQSEASRNNALVFVGTWMRGENREAVLAQLAKAGLPLSIHGDRWQRSPLWSTLKPHWKGGGLHDRPYALALSSASACLGFLSQGNRDLHTHRSLEIPYTGGVLIAQRTSEHVAMYREDEEALFWDDADECVRQCRRVLADPALGARLRTAGIARARQLGVGNQTVVSTILDELMSH